jgi:rhodanese-related sulfurtransferase
MNTKFRWLRLLVLLSTVAILNAAETKNTPHIVLISGEDEYSSSTSLPAFARFLETSYRFNCTYLRRRTTNEMPGLEALNTADLAILFIRRITLPEDQLAQIKKYVASGKPVIGLRTASHAFENWKEWDHEVLGGNYHNHYGDKLRTTIRVNSENPTHPILRNVAARFESDGSLYKTSPLAANTTLLLIGNVEGQPPEPVAWTHTYKGARVFYTSLGHPKDFDNPSFRSLLVNAVFWGLGKNEGPTQIVPKITTDELEKLQRRNEAIVLDVRRPEEFAAGHIPGAINLNVQDPGFDQNAAKLDRNKTYVVHCVHGIRSSQAATKLKALNFNSVLDFSEGYGAWQKAGKSIEK